MPRKKTSKNDIQILHKKKLEFIDLYRQTRGYIADICSAVGIHRQTYYDWINRDDQFAQAIADAEAEINDEMKQALIQHAGDGNLNAVKFWLTHKHPEFKGNDKEATNVNVQVNNFIKNEKDEFGI